MVSAATVLAGCSSDDDNLVTPQKAIVGKVETYRMARSKFGVI